MCGIAAIFAYDADVPGVDEGELVAIRDAMAPRGPDAAGLWTGPNRRIGLGHRRLSIIDISAAGNQPMVLSERDLVIVFNGEIYNHRGLRAELEKKGRRFRSTSDTEVLLHLYAVEGEAMLGKLRGMYAFAIWDGARQSLFAARDPFGIKPLYYSDDGRTLRMASQVKALLAGGQVDNSPEPAGHVGYFLWGHVPAPYTLYRGIRNLRAGHFLTVKAGGKRTVRPFCQIPDLLAESENAEGGRRKEEFQNSELLRSALTDSVRHHLIADVPVGVFLSSGLDSTTLAALAAEAGGRLRTVTLGFEEYKGTADDETPLAEQVARQYGAEHQTIWVTRKDFESDLHRLLQAMDQPTSDGVNSYFISQAAARAGLKVVLSGLGGDELFGSYPGFREIPRAVSLLRPFNSLQMFGRAARLIQAPLFKRFTSPKYASLLEYGGTYGGAYFLRRGMFMPWELAEILDGDLVREGLAELRPVARLDEMASGIRAPHLKISALEMCWYMRHQLLRDADWAGMAHSLEVRVPLVDIELLRSVAPLFTREPRPTKRDMAQTPRSAPPPSVLDRPKTGFVVPVRDWLLQAFDPTPGTERGLRGWAREVYSTFAGNLENHRAALRRRKLRRNGNHPAANSPRSAPGSRKLRVLALLSDGFGGSGGIAKFNRDFLTALCSDENVEEVVALPRVMPLEPGPLPPKLIYNTAGLGGKIRYGRVVLAAAREKAGFDLIICAHIHLLPLALASRAVTPRRRPPLHLVVHGVDAWNPTRSFLANACVRRVDGFISVSNVTKRRFMRWSRLRDDQGVLLPNCVDVSAFTPGAKSEALLDRYGLRGRKILLTFGRLASEERYKGFDEVLEIMPALLREMPDLAYLICGDGPDRPRLVQKAKALGLRVFEKAEKQKAETLKAESSNTTSAGSFSAFRDLSISEFTEIPPQVIFAGRIADAEKAGHFRLADAYVMPSSGEGFGIVYLEALACGVPVIGSRADGSREALLNGKLGVLVDPRDREEIIGAVRNVLRPSGGKNPPAPQDGDSVEHFSVARFQKRVHEILECITN